MIGNIVAGTFSVPVAPITTSYWSIATTTVGSGGTSSITFNDGGAWGSYKHLQIRMMAKSTTANINSDIAKISLNGNTITKNHALYGDGSNPYAFVGGAGDVAIIPRVNYTSTFGISIIDILDFSSSTKNKTIRSLDGYDANGVGEISLYSNLYATNTDPITSITLTCSLNNFAEYSHFALYGIKD